MFGALHVDDGQLWWSCPAYIQWSGTSLLKKPVKIIIWSQRWRRM